jgi:hypothetical protein
MVPRDAGHGCDIDRAILVNQLERIAEMNDDLGPVNCAWEATG